MSLLTHLISARRIIHEKEYERCHKCWRSDGPGVHHSQLDIAISWIRNTVAFNDYVNSDEISAKIDATVKENEFKSSEDIFNAVKTMVLAETAFLIEAAIGVQEAKQGDDTLEAIQAKIDELSKQHRAELHLKFEIIKRMDALEKEQDRAQAKKATALGLKALKEQYEAQKK